MTSDFFAQHGVVTLICLALFPRGTLLLASFASGGLFWWLGFIFAPRLLVAFLALPYWNSNPVLVLIAWVVALGGTSGEAAVVIKVRL